MRQPKEHLLAAGVAGATLLTALQEGAFSSTASSGLSLLLWWIVLAGLAFGVLPRASIPRLGQVGGALILAFALLFGLSATWSTDAGRAFEGAVRAGGYAGLFVLVLLAARRGEARPWLHGLALGLTTVAALALATRIVPSLGGDEALVRLIPSARGRLSYPIGYWNGLAAMMAVALVLLAWLGTSARGRPVRALSVSLLPLPALVIYLASSRGGVAAAVAGLIALVAAGTHRTRTFVVVLLGGAGTSVLIAFAAGKDQLLEGASGPAASDEGLQLLGALLAVTALLMFAALLLDRPLQALSPPAWLRLPAAAAIAAGLVAVVLIGDPGGRWEEFKSPPSESREADGFISSHLTSGSGSGRYQFWSTALDAFSEEPVRGIGGGGYEAWWTQRAPFPYSLQNAHSLFLETLAELGLAGALLLFGFFGVCLAGAVREAGRRGWGVCLAVLVAGLVSAGVDWTWQLPAVFAPVIVVCGLVTGAAVPRRGEGADRIAADPERSPSQGLRLVPRLAGIGLAVVAICASSILLLSSARLETSRDAASDGDYETALEAARQAVAIQPWAAAPRLQEGLVLERVGAVAPALEAVRGAAERATDDWRALLVLSRLQLRLGLGEAALRSLREAKALNPQSTLLER